jgi:D-glycero-D-manno-heptose 1,7-bisphosphate phosphatase
MNAKLSPAVILDRDGTLHRDTGYLIRFEDFEPLEGVDEALNILKDLGFRLFVATNQSGVARGMFTLDAVNALNAKIRSHFLEKGVNLEDMAVCPHHPQGTVAPYARDCDCRKPKPGLLLDLAKRHGLDLSRSYMVGDHVRDAEAGVAAGAMGVRIGNQNRLERLDSGGRLKEFESLLAFARSVRGKHDDTRA